MNIKLTRREKEIYNLLIDGTVPKEICDVLNISYDTVLSHQKRIYRKLSVHSIDELINKHQSVNNDSSACSADGHICGKRQDYIIIPKFWLPIGAAGFLVLLIGLSYLFGMLFFAEKPVKNRNLSALEGLTVPDPLIITLEDNSPWGWIYKLESDMFIYDNELRASPYKLAGAKIIEDEVYLISCTFTSNVDMIWLDFYFLDETERNGEFRTLLSSYRTIKFDIEANVEYNESIVVKIFETANDTSERANRLVFWTGPGTVEQPTLTFTKFSVEKL